MIIRKYNKPWIKLLKNKRVFVTGGTGSFGNFFVQEVLKYNPKQIVIFSRDEDKQHSMQEELSHYSKVLRFVIGDVRDKECLIKALSGGVDIFVHAAALKQVPTAEYNIFEAVKTNVLGAQNVVDACLACGVKKAVTISTDKAVEPVNVYGMTKAISERIFVLGNKYKNGGWTRFGVVRYGNVMGSRGSILRVFKRQMEKGGPFTLTHQEMTRFTITLAEAINLTFIALSNIKGGEVFVPKLATLRIKDLAEVFIEELKPKDKRIIEIGIRPGEKLHETLITPTERSRTIEKSDYFMILPEIGIEGFNRKYPKYKLVSDQVARYSSNNGRHLTKKEIRELLRKENLI